MRRRILRGYRQNLEDTLSNKLGIQNLKIERAHSVGDKNRSSCRTIVAKLSGFNIKEPILTEAKKRKPKVIQVYEDCPKATVKIQKKNWEKVNELRAQNKYAILVHDKYISQAEICRFKNYKTGCVKVLVFIQV